MYCFIVPLLVFLLFFCCRSLIIVILHICANLQEVQDPSVIVNFPLEGDESVCLVAWTTTPWTLPSNLALCVNPELQYVKVKGQ